MKQEIYELAGVGDDEWIDVNTKRAYEMLCNSNKEGDRDK